MTTALGDLCIAYLPEHLLGPYVIMKNKGVNTFGDEAFQVYSSYTQERQRLDTANHFDALRKTIFKPGWNDPNDNKIIFMDQKPARRYTPYVVSRAQIGNKIILNGFTFTTGNRMKKGLVDWMENDAQQKIQYINVTEPIPVDDDAAMEPVDNDAAMEPADVDTTPDSRVGDRPLSEQV